MRSGKALREPTRPLVAIVAGSKVSTKLTILGELAKKVDQLIVGGGIANTFMLAAGLPIGKSLAEPDLVGEARKIMAAMKAKGGEVPMPVDVVCAKEFSADAAATTKDAEDVADDDLILDIGPKTAAQLAEIVAQGRHHRLERPGRRVRVRPLRRRHEGAWRRRSRVAGVLDRRRRRHASRPSPSTASTDKIGYISTGGGAFLEFLEGKKLPAVEILEARAAAINGDVNDRMMQKRSTKIVATLGPASATATCSSA